MKRNKKGFTIIELVIVIAVIGVLTAVLVPVFINLTNKANKAADDSLIKNLNTALKMEEQLLGNPKNETLQDAIEDLKNEGYLLENLVSKTGHDLLWDQEQNQFVLNEKTDLKDGKYWQIVDKIPETQRFSYYAGKNFKDTEVLDLEYGFDAGEYSKIENLEYEPKSGTAKTTRIRTNSDETTLTINAPLDVVKHYGDAKALNIIAVKGSSYHENGKVSFLEISKGRVVLEHDSQVKHIHVSAKTDEQGQKLDEFDSVTIAKEPAKEMPVLSRDDVEIAKDGTLVVALQNGTEEVTEQSDLDYVWLTKQGVYEQIKISDSNESAGEIWVNTSDKPAQTKTAAQQIANNIGTTATVGAQEYTVTVNEETRDIVLKDNDEAVAYTITEDDQGNTVVKDAEGTKIEDQTVVAEVKEGSVEKVADKEDVEKGATLFAGGTGSKNDPFLIVDYNTFQNVSKLSWTYYAYGAYYGNNGFEKMSWSDACTFANGFDTVSGAYYKVKDGIAEIDCLNWNSVYLDGHFDGNNVQLINVDKPLFYSVEGEPVLKNFTVNANIITTSAFSAAVVYNVFEDVVFENVDVHGYLQAGQCASYVAFGPDGSSVIDFKFKNCHSDLTLVATSEQTAGFIDHPYCGTGSKLTLIDSYYDGKQSNVKGTYNYYAYQVFSRLVVSDDYENKASLVSTNSYIKENSTSKIVKGALTLPEVGGTFSIAKATGATYAVAILRIGPNDKNETGNYVGTFMSENCVLNGNIFTTKTVINFNVTINGNSTTTTGASGNIFNVVGQSYGTTYGSANVSIIQYDANNNVVAINEVSIKR